MINKIEELTKKVCRIKAEKGMERVEGIDDRFYAELENSSVKTPVLSKASREKR